MEMDLSTCADYTLRRSTTRIIKFDFGKKKLFVVFLIFYRMTSIIFSCFLECGVMAWGQSDLYCFVKKDCSFFFLRFCQKYFIFFLSFNSPLFSLTDFNLHLLGIPYFVLPGTEFKILTLP